METQLARPPLWRRSIPPLIAFALGLGVWPAVWVMGAGVGQTLAYWSGAFGVLVAVTAIATPGADRPAVAAFFWLVEGVAVAFTSVVLVFAIFLATGDDLLCGSVKADAGEDDCF